VLFARHVGVKWSGFLSEQTLGCSLDQAGTPGAVNLGRPEPETQLLIRCNGNLAVIDCRRRLAAQRDSFLADDIDAHEWVLLIDLVAIPP
jgi:hypothetical protein